MSILPPPVRWIAINLIKRRRTVYRRRSSIGNAAMVVIGRHDCPTAERRQVLRDDEKKPDA
jgi:hypothetical protein